MNRQQEVRDLLSMSREQMLVRADGRLLILRDVDAMHRHLAETIAAEVQANNARGQWTRLILPVGPVGQYPILSEMINSQRICLRRCWFFFMDEYCDDNGHTLPASHPLSFRREMDELFFGKISNDLMIPPEQLIFPDRHNVQRLGDKIETVGGIDTCYGGIGIHGHVAFNEPEPNVWQSEPRLVYLNDFTRTINSIRANVGGDLVNFPRKAITLGMRQIAAARRIRLYCRNGIVLDWANTVLRLAVFGEPGDDYPVTHLRGHGDYLVVTDEDTASASKYRI